MVVIFNVSLFFYYGDIFGIQSPRSLWHTIILTHGYFGTVLLWHIAIYYGTGY